MKSTSPIRAVSVPPRWPAPDCRTATSTVAICDRDALRAVSDVDPSRHLVRPRIDDCQCAAELVAHPDEARPDGDRHWAVPGRSDRCDLIRRRIDPRDGSVQAVRDPRRAAAEGDSRWAIPDVDRLHDGARRRVDARHLTRRTLGRPQGSGAEGELGRGDRQRPRGLAAVGIDFRDRAVARIRDPDRAFCVGDSDGAVSDLDPLHHGAGCRDRSARPSRRAR